MIPALAFNVWALGSPFEFAYGAAVDTPGFSGHDTLGLNDDGFFGITAPRLDAAVDLLVANRGLLVLTPVIAAAVAGVVMMRRGAHRAEANVILAIAAVYFVYNAGYWLTFGGGTPGPRFLIPALPFVALGLATAYRRMPALTLGLAIPSALMMVSASLVYPLLGEQGPGTWFEFIVDGRFEHTLLSVRRRLQRLGRDRPGRGRGGGGGRARGQGDAVHRAGRSAERRLGGPRLGGDRRRRSQHRRRRGDAPGRRPEPDLPGGGGRGRLAADPDAAGATPAPRSARRPGGA